MDANADVVMQTFRKVWLWDATTARPGSVADYQSLFPGYEDVVAAEYERLSSEYPSEEDARAAGKSRVGPYQLDSFLGRGGQGAVYEATDTRNGRKVALKVLAADAGMSERRLVRLRREAEAIGRVDHPGICRIHEAGLDGDVPYLALHLVPGRTLADAIGRARRDRPEALATVDAAAALAIPAEGVSSNGAASGPAWMRVVRFFEEAARAVHAANEAGLVHRDVKPGNLMITPSGDPVVLDFGLARDEEEGRTITLTGALLGTPAYMAPEQVAPGRGRLDRRVDVYALGVSLFEALTLMHPFEAPTIDAAARAGLLHDAKNLRDLDPRFPKDLALIVATAMRRDRDRRYVTALALAEDLRAFRLGRRIAARPPNVAQRLGDWAARHPATAAASAVAFVALVAGLAVTLNLLAETRDALDDATAAKEEARKAGERANNQLAKTSAALAEVTAAKESAKATRADSLRMIEYLSGYLQERLYAAGRAELISDLAARVDAFLKTLPENDLSDAELATVADAWATLGFAYETQSRRVDRIRCTDRAFGIRAGLYARWPDDPEVVRDWADSIWAKARLEVSEPDLDAALATFRQADGLFAGVTGPLAEEPRVRNDHARVVRSLGVLERRLSLPESLATLRRALAASERLVAEWPDDVYINVDATEAAVEVSVSLDDLGDLTAASALADNAARRAREFAASHADEPLAQDALARALTRDGDCAYDRGNVERACAAAAEVRDIYGALHAREPGMARWRNNFVSAHQRLVRALLDAKRIDEALGVSNAGLKLMEGARKAPVSKFDPDALVAISQVLRTHAGVLRQSGAVDEALKVLAESASLLEHAAEKAPDDANVRFGLVLQHQSLAATLAASADAAQPPDGPAAQDARRRSLAALAESGVIAQRMLDARPDSAKVERQRAFILREAAAVRRKTGDLAGAVAALEEAVRIRDGLAKKDALFVARLADLDALLADARKSAVVSPSTK